ncbi:MAG: SIMPL domain-containing protein [Bacteroidales bacterium]|nr:SIMPL domain-containing protein [Bacteroidales bacterium]MDD2424667.1 SIMPL domain-containing protein [Bacteroidales bacterium]MDD3989113.1 SIMPL domain-containing protein [Bacteroidales bacterium]MDD4638134.1 SIMPL domain-containing protein [Bacteroidales bacterium]
MERSRENRYLLPSLAIMTGLIAIGIAIYFGISGFRAANRIVSVKGLAEIELPANKVIWPIVYKEIGDDLLQLYKTINEKNRAIIGFLKDKGLDETEISLSAPKIIDMNAERYQSQNSRYRYNVTSVLTVTSEKVDKVREIISSQSELLAKGIAISAGEYEYETIYMYTKLNDVKPGMIEEATRNARASAEKFAKDSGSKLGKIKSANQGQFSISNRDANTPHIKVIRVVSTIDYLLRD